MHVLDVGQGDAILLRTDKGRWVLIDAGRIWDTGDAGRSTVIPYVMRRGGRLESFILSHAHSDHVGGAASVFRALHPHTFWDAAFAQGSDVYDKSLRAAREAGVEWHRVHPGDELDLDGVAIEFLAPDSAWTASLADPNEASTIALVRFGSVRFLLVGDDAERTRHTQMHQQHIARPKIGQEIFRAPADTCDGLPLEPRHKILLQRKPQIAAPRLGFDNQRTLHRRLQPAADSFDFGEFRHDARISCASQAMPGRRVVCERRDYSLI